MLTKCHHSYHNTISAKTMASLLTKCYHSLHNVITSDTMLSLLTQCYHSWLNIFTVITLLLLLTLGCQSSQNAITDVTMLTLLTPDHWIQQITSDTNFHFWHNIIYVNTSSVLLTLDHHWHHVFTLFISTEPVSALTLYEHGLHNSQR